MANTLNLGDGNWGVKDSSLLGYRKDGSKFLPETFDVTRASGGTRVNKSGLIETPTEIVSGELVTNGDFSNGSTGWQNFDANASVVDGKLECNNVVSNVNIVAQVNVVPIQKQVKLTYDVVINSGSVRILLGSSGTTTVVTTSGTYTFYETSGTGGTLTIQARTGGFDGSIDNVSVVEITQDNLARIDYSDGADGVLLTEPQSTNLVTYSEDFSDSSWVATGATNTLSTTELSPNGVDYSTLLVGDSTVSSTKRIRYGGTTSLLTSHSFSVYIKSDSRNYVQLVNSTDTQGYANFDIVNGLVGTSGSKTTSKITSLSNGWFRCEMTTDATTTNGQFMIYLVNTNIGAFAPASTGTDGVYIWGAQLEELSYATSYIPTYGAIASRSGDVVTNGGDVTNFNGEEGVLFAEVAINGLHPMYIQLSDGTYDNRVSLINNNSATSWRTFYRVGGVSQIDETASFLNAFEMNKIAISWKINEFKFFVNGVKISEINSGAVNAANTFNTLDFSDIGDTNNFYGKTKNIQVFNEALTDAELQTLTTI